MPVSHEGPLRSVTMHSYASVDKAAAYELQGDVPTEETKTVCIGPSCVGEHVQCLSDMHV